jgi:hypothetical protein
VQLDFRAADLGTPSLRRWTFAALMQGFGMIAGEARTPLGEGVFVVMERTGIEPVTSGLQSPIRTSGLTRTGRELPGRTGFSAAPLRGSPGAVGAFRRPRAGWTRDEVVAWLRNTTSTGLASPRWTAVTPSPSRARFSCKSSLCAVSAAPARARKCPSSGTRLVPAPCCPCVKRPHRSRDAPTECEHAAYKQRMTPALNELASLLIRARRSRVAPTER